MGQLRKRGNIWWLRYYRDGRRHEESSHSTKKGDAERLLRIREGDVAKGLPVSLKLGRLRFEFRQKPPPCELLARDVYEKCCLEVARFPVPMRRGSQIHGAGDQDVAPVSVPESIQLGMGSPGRQPFGAAIPPARKQRRWGVRPIRQFLNRRKGFL